LLYIYHINLIIIICILCKLNNCYLKYQKEKSELKKKFFVEKKKRLWECVWRKIEGSETKKKVRKKEREKKTELEKKKKEENEKKKKYFITVIIKIHVAYFIVNSRLQNVQN
jgi:hypothetical protein